MYNQIKHFAIVSSAKKKKYLNICPVDLPTVARWFKLIYAEVLCKTYGAVHIPNVFFIVMYIGVVLRNT